MTRHKKFTEQVEAVYQDAVENIRLAKNQQWRVTNYAALIYAAVIFLDRGSSFSSKELQSLLSIIALATFGFSIGMLIHLQSIGIGKARGRICWVYENCFTSAERNNLKLQPRTAWDDPAIVTGLMVASFVGAILALMVTRA